MNEPVTASGNEEAPSQLWEAEPPRILPNRDRDIFLALLDVDHEPTEAAKEAAARFNRGYFVGEIYHFQTSAPALFEVDNASREN